MSIWTISSTGRARAAMDDFAVTVDSADPTTGVALQRPHAAETRVLAIRDAGDAPLPPRSEFYARGGEFTASYPQTADSLFGFQLRYALQRIDNLHLLSLTVAVQTSLLDCHPTLDVALCAPARVLAAADGTDADEAATRAPLSAIEIESSPPLLLVQRQHDAQVNTLYDADSRNACLRVFAEFMEKGVIRKTQLWLVLDADRPPLQRIADLLADLPLPLTA